MFSRPRADLDRFEEDTVPRWPGTTMAVVLEQSPAEEPTSKFKA